MAALYSHSQRPKIAVDLRCYSGGGFTRKWIDMYVVSRILPSRGCVTLSNRYYDETYVMPLFEPELVVPEPEELR